MVVVFLLLLFRRTCLIIHVNAFDSKNDIDYIWSDVGLILTVRAGISQIHLMEVPHNISESSMSIVQYEFM